MEKAKISSYQLFVLMFLFELGSALLVPLAMGAKQDAWIAILIGMVGGFFLFFIYLRLYFYYPDIPPTEYAQRIMGKWLGRCIAFFYILYFAYLAARVLRDFGEMLITFAYPETPLFITNTLFMLVVIYGVRKGIEVMARAGELLFVLMYLLAAVGFVLIVASGLIDLNNIKPILEEGIRPVVKTALTQTLFIPFGESVVFAMIFPYLNNPKKLKWTGLCALGLSGFNLAIAMAINISVLGVDLATRSQFPLLSTVQSISIAEFLERLDVFFMLALIINGFFKIGLFFYVTVTATASLFKIKKPSSLAYPLGIVTLLLSNTIASNFSEHLQEGLRQVPFILHLPFQVIIPLLLLIVAFFINRKKSSKQKNDIHR